MSGRCSRPATTRRTAPPSEPNRPTIPTWSASRCAARGRTWTGPPRARLCTRSRRLSLPVAAALFVEPHILEAPAVVGAVDHDRQALDLGPPAGRFAQV